MIALLIALSTAVVCLSVALWRSRQTIERQAEEIEALLAQNLELRGQAAELATLAHEASDRKELLAKHGASLALRSAMVEAMLHTEIEAHRATKRKLSAARGRITRLTR